MSMRTARLLIGMSCPLIAFFVLSVAFTHAVRAADTPPSRFITPFDSDWRFINTDAREAQAPDFDDASWRKLDVPHDWSIESAPAQTNPAGGAGAFFPNGIGWYRKHFTLPDEDAQKHFFIDFDGIMANSDVWINGFHLGNRPYGYISLHYELTGHLNFGAGKTNVLAVRANLEQQPASRFYTGSGIVRHVRLVKSDAVHFEHDSVFISTPDVTANRATVRVKCTVVNQSDKARNIAVITTFTGPDGKPVESSAGRNLAQIIEPGKSADYSLDEFIAEPKLWNLDQPQLYLAKTSAMDLDSNAAFDQQTPFGIRTFKFTPETGFSLNGKDIRIQGVCLHADGSAFGMAVPTGVWEHRLAQLKVYGVNGIRTAHNPPDPAFLDLCDRMGFVVMDEMFDCWDVGKTKYDYHLYFDKWSEIDTRDTVRRDRNHPSVFLYSSGNEIHDTPNAQASLRILGGLVKVFHDNDPTRPVTQALFRPNVSHDYTDGLSDLLDVVGTNYRMSELLAAQKAKPTRTLVGTENHVSDAPILANNPPLSGIYIWAGIDYLGESAGWPRISSGANLLDRMADPHPLAYQIAQFWVKKPFVQMLRSNGGARRGNATANVGGNAAGADPANPGGFVDPVGPNNGAVADTGANPAHTARPGPSGPMPDWSPANAAPHPETVIVYSNCPSVELFLNGVSVGKNTISGINGRNFTVNYAPGTLKAVAYDAGGQTVATNELNTAGPAAKIVLTPEKTQLGNTWDDVSFVRAEVTDANGIVVPSAGNEITFKVSGAGNLAAMDSADPFNHEGFYINQRQAYNGVCFAIVKANAASGKISVEASAEGLSSATTEITATRKSAE
jgi:beta-galactosidase